MAKLKIITLLLFNVFCINSQMYTANDSICSELVALNKKIKLLPEQFDSLVDCLDTGILSYQQASVIRFEQSIIINDSSKSLFYVRERENLVICNGYYGIMISPNNELSYGFKVKLNAIKYVNSKYNAYIYAGLKNGIPEAKWIYNILGSENISKEENYIKGLLNGNYMIATANGDTLYQTQFRNGTGYYKDYYGDGNIQMEGNLINGIANGRWIFYKYANNKLYELFIEDYNMGEFISREIFVNPPAYKISESLYVK